MRRLLTHLLAIGILSLTVGVIWALDQIGHAYPKQSMAAAILIVVALVSLAIYSIFYLIAMDVIKAFKGKGK